MVKKVVITLLLVVVVAIGGGIGYLALRKPAQQPARNIHIEPTPERLARGRYIFTTLADCDGCHSERDFSRFDGPVVDSGRGKGIVFPDTMGLPGTVVAHNITPDRETGIGTWTDGEKMRAIRGGVDRDGNVLFPMMPYEFYRHMSDEDVMALVAYMDTLTPIRNPLPPTKISFPLNLMIKSVPQPVGSVPPPDRSNKIKYGEYVANLGGCLECHTPLVRGQMDEKFRFAGGREFKFPGMEVVSANITPDLDTGIGKWTEQQFLDKFYSYKKYAENGSPKVGAESFTIMPWLKFCQWPAEDLSAVYAYLRTQPAIHHPVETHPGQEKKGNEVASK